MWPGFFVSILTASESRYNRSISPGRREALSTSPSMREQIIAQMITSLQPLDHVISFWEAGSAATGLLDAHSDLDLQLVVQDGTVEETAQEVEAALARVRPVELRYEIPSPTWHGNWQAFYRLRDTDPYLLIDLMIMEARQTNRFLEPEMHGIPIVYFDKQSLVSAAPVDPFSFAARLKGRLAALEYPFALFHPFVDKELARGRFIDAFHFYHGILLTRLIEALRILYAPWRHNFGARYLHKELPPDLYTQVERLFYVASPDDLRAKKALLLDLFADTLAQVKSLDLEAHLRTLRAPAFQSARNPEK